jgi:acetyl-CoA carboxylase carboxyltransferase component
MPVKTISSPMQGIVVNLAVEIGQPVTEGEIVLVIEAMKVQTNVKSPCAGKITAISVSPMDMVEANQSLVTVELDTQGKSSDKPVNDQAQAASPAIMELKSRLGKTLDTERLDAQQKRHSKGYRTARENLADLCDIDTFVEYGQLAVAAQRDRIAYTDLQSTTAADGILTGVGRVNENQFDNGKNKVALIVNDYSVLAGTQGFYHHKKLDRILAVAAQQSLPVIMFTEGGGGRPGDTEVTVVNSGLQCESFGSWAALSGKVPRITVANGYNFAGNAALFGAGDVTIATKSTWIGMAGPAMISGGGLGDFKPTQIGPIETQSINGVVDLVAEDEADASKLAKQCMSWFQGSIDDYSVDSQDNIGQLLPNNRRAVYPVRTVLEKLFDVGSVIELKPLFGGAIVTALARLGGQPVGVIANDCAVLGGAIDVDAGEKAADFIKLCDQFNKPIISLCDTPGFMVGPEHEELGAVRRLAKLFTAGAQFKPLFLALVLRKCYGLGAQAMLGGSSARPDYIAAWPSGEFGPMGLEGAVKLGFKKELDAAADSETKKALFDRLLAQQYARGKAIEVASVLEIDAVIDPSQSRSNLLEMLEIAR